MIIIKRIKKIEIIVVGRLTAAKKIPVNFKF